VFSEILIGLVGMCLGGYFFWRSREVADKHSSAGGATDRLWTKANVGGVGIGMFLIGLGWLIKGIV
jgi:hypothetical protein